MSTRTLLPLAAVAVLAAAPVAALADLQVNANGFERVVAYSTKGASCDVVQSANGASVRCPEGSAGTLTVYSGPDESAACEIDFWSQAGNGPRTWRAIVSHPNSANGTCSLHWDNGTTLDVSLSH